MDSLAGAKAWQRLNCILARLKSYSDTHPVCALTKSTFCSYIKCTGFPGGKPVQRTFQTAGLSEGGAASEPILLSSVSSSMGSGKTMVVFFSTPISVRVCR